MEKQRRMPNVGETLKGVYQLQGVLGEGGFAKAFSGRDNQENVSIAIKVLKLTSANDILQFSLEAFRMLKLDHQNLVKVTDYDVEEEILPFIVMPLAANGSLGNEIKKRRARGEDIPFQRSIIAIEQIGDALAYLHGKRIFHQDVKPDNILEPDNNDFWLSDLGIARILKPNDSLQQRSIGFSPQYVSPEQSQGRSVFASDQYSLGICAFLLLTGRLPFDGKTAYQLVYQHRVEKPISLVEAVQGLKNGERIINILRALDPVLQKSLAKEPEKRHESVTIFTEALKNRYEEASSEKLPGKKFEGIFLAKQESQRLFKKALKLAESGSLQEALQIFDKVIDLDSSFVEAFANKSITLYNLGRFEDSLKVYEEIIRLEPDNSGAYNNKGEILVELKRFEEALESFNKAVKLSPDNDIFLNNKKNVLYDLRRVDDGLRVYDEIIRLHPNDPEVLMGKAYDLTQHDKYEEAMATFDKAIDLTPISEKARMLNLKASALIVLKRFEEAIKGYEEIIKFDPDNKYRSREAISTIKHLLSMQDSNRRKN